MPAHRLALALSAAVLALSGCSADPSPAAALAPASADSSATPAAPTGTAVGTTEPAPPAGTVARGAGPFDDRFTLEALTLTAGTVTGQVTVTSDVSELIVMEVAVVFYDAAGDVLGDAVQVHPVDGVDEELYENNGTFPITVTAPDEVRSRVSSARVAVPVLVNE